MNIKTIQLEENDTIWIRLDVGNMPPTDIDKYMSKALNTIKGAFGKCPIYMCPVRNDNSEGPEITIFKKPITAAKSKK